MCLTCYFLVASLSHEKCLSLRPQVPGRTVVGQRVGMWLELANQEHVSEVEMTEQVFSNLHQQNPVKATRNLSQKMKPTQKNYHT